MSVLVIPSIPATLSGNEIESTIENVRTASAA
jgi:hypothetical protein